MCSAGSALNVHREGQQEILGDHDETAGGEKARSSVWRAREPHSCRRAADNPGGVVAERSFRHVRRRIAPRA